MRKYWESQSINDLIDSFGQEWTYRDRKHLEFTCHTAYFVSFIIAQWANVITCKTQRLSIFTQGMKNWAINFSIVFETLIAVFLSYTPGMDQGMHMYPLRINWWLPAMPFAVLLLAYEEVRKLIMRFQQPGSWLEAEFCY